MAHVIKTLEDAKALEGQEVGVSNWILVDQERINKFADATDDHQWIHTDPERAAREFPLGTTCAHGYLTISLIPALIDDIVEFVGLERLINYGINKLRFPNAVTVGSRIRAHCELVSAEEVKGSIELTEKYSVEIEGQDKPACIAECVMRLFF